MGSKLKNVQEYIEETVKNIRDDRSVTSNLLTDLLIEMKKTSDVDNHKQLGLIASKYVETLQRSNEQLVKIAALVQKQTSKEEEDVSLSSEDKDELFDLIQGNGNG
tara:strand:- start:331 stop:648 length:318 start_codon:yes stop_codon:yes gene_type:complete